MLAIAFLTAVVLGLLPQLAWATIDNHCEAQRLSETAHQFEHGYYTITNAGTGDSISYKNSNGHWFYPSSGDPASLELQSSENSTFAWTSVHVQDTNKCASAQWNYTYCEGNGCDWSAVLYRCAIDEHAYEGATVNTDKQYWLFVPSETNDKAYYIIAVDHLSDMATRGWKSCRQTTTDAGVQSTCLEELDFEDPAFQWYVTTTGEEVPDTVSTYTPASTAGPTVTVTMTVTQTATNCANDDSSKAKRALNRRAAIAAAPEPEWPAIKRRSLVQDALVGSQKAAPTPGPTAPPNAAILSKFKQPARGRRRD